MCPSLAESERNMNVKLDFEVGCCDDCMFYYYSDLHDVCTQLKIEIPYSEAEKSIHPQCPFLGDDDDIE